MVLFNLFFTDECSFFLLLLKTKTVKVGFITNSVNCYLLIITINVPYSPNRLFINRIRENWIAFWREETEKK